MANQPDTKLKLLHLLDILRERTDESHGLSTQEIIEALAERGIDAARKSVYRDIEVLREAGYEVEVRREPYATYALRSREFEIEEMILLVDAVQSCPFLTDEMTDTLIAKVGALASAGQREMLARRVDVPARVKMQNESVFANLDVIQFAMRVRRKVRFRYFKYGPRKEKVLQLGGRFYEYAPVRLVYHGGYYYLLAYSERYEDWVNYRVDRMLDVEVTDEPFPRDRRYESYDPTEQEPWAFGVFNSTPAKVTLAVEPDAMSLVIDKLGTDVDTVVSRDGKVRVYARVAPSYDFYGWLFQVNDVVTLEAPKRIVREYHRRLEQALDKFGQDDTGVVEG